MRLSTPELVSVGLLIVYVAFFTHPAPQFIKTVLSSPVGHAVALLAILYVTVYKSLITGVFLAIAYLMTASSVTEHLDPKHQTPEKKHESKIKEKIRAPSNIQKGDTLAHMAKPGKSQTTPPPSTQPVKPATPIKSEHFSLF
uniref:Uncharacterized protein n=1 Tax=viral metagenome TaxID=1070528 RepID=A0A6C0CHB6_9ZZZZ